MTLRILALSLHLVVVSVLTLQGCGGGGSSPSATTTTTTITTTTATQASNTVSVTQTAFNGGKNPDLLKQMPTVTMVKSDPPKSQSLQIDRTKKFQQMLGFGGAFTEAAADNWMKLSKADQEKVIQLYFADPKDNGHGYTVGRVPMGSCDFTLASYNFDNVSGDVDMTHFDTTVKHDETSGMLPMIRAAQELVHKRNLSLKVFASPWSPPAWMKNPVDGKQSMTGSAKPLGLNAQYQAAWAKYFSKFITAYKGRGVDLWGVTVQNEPEFAAAWEACVYTPEFEATFVRDHLGPLLNKDHPGLKIIGFDHNKDHVVEWAQALYKDPDTAKFFDGLGVHWYGGLNTQHLDAAHNIAPDKFILATEACNCGSVAFQKDDAQEWWARAEKLAIDILEDIKWWSVGWVDWNLVLDTTGGPNHLGNLCDANIIADPDKKITGESVILQASYYYMGHFSRFIPPGSHRIDLVNNVAPAPLQPADVLGKRFKFSPCSDGNGMTWSYDEKAKTLQEYGLCAELDGDGRGIVMKACSGNSKQQWTIADGKNPGEKSIKHIVIGVGEKCVTAETVSGPVVGLDPGVDVEAGLAENCGDVAGQIQTFELTASGDKTFPQGFHIKASDGNCMIPVGGDTINFDAVAFESETGDVSVIAMNMGEQDIDFDLYDLASQAGGKTSVPKRSITSFTFPASNPIKIVV